MTNLVSVIPSSASELADCLRDARETSRTVNVVGQDSKRSVAGPILPADITLSTTGLTKVLHYERDDLTVSVEAGMRFAALQEFLGGYGQMIALDPPFSETCSVGGVLASNSSGPQRRGFGTARDMVIGMTFATLQGRLVKTGGMVVKNVAGLDMGKLIIGSFGTLAVITSANFRVHPLPEETQTFLFASPDLDAVLEKAKSVRTGYLRPMSIDVLSPSTAEHLGANGYVLAVRAGGARAVLDRYLRELGAVETISGAPEATWWKSIVDYTPRFLDRQPTGIVLRVSTPLSEVARLLHTWGGQAISRSASGVTYLYASSWEEVPSVWKLASESSWALAVEHAPDEIRRSKELWLQPKSAAAFEAFVMMEKVKNMFDPAKLLNRSRLYGKL